LAKLKLRTKDLVFLLLECCLGFLQGSLELLLLNLESPALLVQLVNGAAAVAELESI
jgi:hypothetical protein